MRISDRNRHVCELYERMLDDHQERNWRKCPGGAKPACTITLEGQKPFLSVDLQVDNSVVGQDHAAFFTWEDIAPLSATSICLVID